MCASRRVEDKKSLGSDDIVSRRECMRTHRVARHVLHITGFEIGHEGHEEVSDEGGFCEALDACLQLREESGSDMR